MSNRFKRAMGVDNKPDAGSVALKGDGIVLRPLAPEYAPGMFAAISESAAELGNTMLWWHAGFSLEETRNWAELTQSLWAQGKHYEFAIIDEQSGDYLGSCSLESINEHLLSANLAYWVRTSRTGRGIASRAARIVAQWGCAALGLQRIEILVVASNTPSLGAARKAGAVEEGLLRNRLRRDKQEFDAMMFSFVPADFA